MARTCRDGGITAGTVAAEPEPQSPPDRWVPFPNTADRSFKGQPEGVSRFSSQTRSGTTPNLRKQLNGDRAPRTSSAPANILPAGYAGRPVVRGLDLELEPRTILGLLGPNGAGKSTILNTLAGLLPPIGGVIELDGAPMPAAQPHRVARSGVVLVPDDRALFTQMTIMEHLELAHRPSGLTVDEVLSYFPGLTRRLHVCAGTLSGGEQQMLAMARALIQRPRVLLIDEMSMGLAPAVINGLAENLRRAVKSTGVAIVLVEQHVAVTLKLADEVMVLVHGEVRLRVSGDDARAAPASIERAYFGHTPDVTAHTGSQSETGVETELPLTVHRTNGDQ